MATTQKKFPKRICLSEKNVSTACNITHIPRPFYTLIYLAFPETVQRITHIIYATICLSIFFTLITVRKTQQTSSLNCQWCCSTAANKHPSQTIFWHFFNLSSRVLTPYCQKELQHPPNQGTATLVSLILYLLKQTEEHWYSGNL